MTRANMVAVVRGLDRWHVEGGLGNLRLKIPDGVVSMICGWLGRLPDAQLIETLTDTFGIDPVQVTCPEDLCADGTDVAHCNQQWKADMFQGADK